VIIIPLGLGLGLMMMMMLMMVVMTTMGVEDGDNEASDAGRPLLQQSDAACAANWWGLDAR